MRSKNPSASVYILLICCLYISTLLSPALSLASEGSAQFFVSAYLVRIWLAMLGGIAVVSGVILAMNGYAGDHTLAPEKTGDSGVALRKIPRLSYLKVSSGLLCVILGCAFFVTAVFLLPDKRTGHSGLGKIAAHFKTAQAASEPAGPDDGETTAH